MEEKHCPKCGTPLEMQDGDLICPKCFEEELKKAIEAKVRKQMQMERLEQEARERIFKEEKELFKQERLKFAGLRIEGDYAYYGEFPQSEVSDPSLIKELLALESKDNPIHYQGNLYAQLGKRFFLYEPIKWRVLERKEKAALLISDALLEKGDFSGDSHYEEIENAYAWLESHFLRVAFPDGGAHILPYDGNPFFFPSRATLENEAYGFKENQDRVAKPTAYAVRDKEYPHLDEGHNYATSTTEEVLFGYLQADYVRADGALDRGSPCESCLRICACVELEEGECKKENLTSLEGMVPRKVGDKILYGRYPQSEVPILETALAQKYGDKTEKHVVYGDQEYLPGAHYRIEPISWTVISKNEDDYELVSDKILDSHIRGEDGPGRFGESHIGTWLNGVFLRDAFPDGGAATLERNGSRIWLPDEKNLTPLKEMVPTVYAASQSRSLADSPHCWVVSHWSLYPVHLFPFLQGWRPYEKHGVRPRIFIHLPPTEEELALEAKKKAEEEERIRLEEEAEAERQRLELEKRKREEEERRLEEKRQRQEQERLAEEERKVAEQRRQAEEAKRKELLKGYPTYEELKAVMAKPIVSENRITYGVYPRSWASNILPSGDWLQYGPYSIIDGHLFYHDQTGWYCVEPIHWAILKKEGGAALVISEEIIDRRRFHEFYKGKKPFFGGFYASNYAHSEIRKWLNDEFLYLAFSDGGASILAKEIDNSEASFTMGSGKKDKWRICENTVDKVFLLSDAEAEEFRFKDFPALENIAEATPYSDRNPFDERYKNVFWGRTPDLISEGEIMAFETIRSMYSPKVDSTDPGLRPAMWIKIPE